MRRELGGYVWVQEFQARGVVHFYVLCEREVGENRVRLVWCRAIDALGDGDAFRYGAKAEVVRSEDATRSYLGRYVGKERQKLLPPGVDGSGRWWGASRSLQLKLLAEMVVCEQDGQEHHPMVLFVMRCVRRYLTRKLGYKFRGGRFVDWGGKLAAQLADMMESLRAAYMRQESAWVASMQLEKKWGWELVEGVEWPCKEEVARTGSCTCADDASGKIREEDWRNWRSGLKRAQLEARRRMRRARWMQRAQQWRESGAD
jgi:hypothetical protein